MAAKYQLITELYRRTGAAVSRNPQAWQNFLSSACRNYKCRFDEQLLIFAQRPDAIAVTTLEIWNKQFKRWVNKDSKGIAVFDTKGRRNTLKYYFDISDTHEGYYYSRPVPIWQMDERYEQAVIERLSDRFGDLEVRDLGEALMQTAENAVEDNLPDYLAQLKDCTKDSFLEELDDLNVEVIYKRLAVNSVAFMLMSRCGLDTGEYFETEDFSDITNFNTPATINAIGIAASDISEMALREISQTVRNVQITEKSRNRTFAQPALNPYDKDRKQPERSNDNERNHLHETGRLSYSRPNITDRARNSAWQIRYDAQGLSGAAQESDLSQSADIGQAQRTSLPDRTDSPYKIGASDEAALSGAGRDGGTERESADAVGRADEQYPQPSGGSHLERTDLQLTSQESEPQAKDDWQTEGVPAVQLEESELQGSIADETEVRANLPTVEEQMEMIAEAEDEKSSAFSVSQEDIDSVLLRGSNFQNGKYSIYRQFQKNEDNKKNIEFLKKEYGIGNGTHYFPDGTKGHEWHDGKGIAIEKYGSSDKPDLLLTWSKVAKRLRELIKNDRYLNEKEKDHYADYLERVEAPQYEIDTQRRMSRQRFIDAKRDLPPADKRDTLALRLSDFIRDLDGYEKDLLSEVERTDLADVTTEQMEQHLSDPATVQQLIDFLKLVQGKTADVYSRSNAWRFGQELLELHPLHYLYHEGDVVYIGADKYEVLTISEDSVFLQNAEFPLFSQTFSRGDLEEKLKENAANDHLKVVVTEKQSVQPPSEEKSDSLKFSIGFSEHPAFYDRELNDRYTKMRNVGGIAQTEAQKSSDLFMKCRYLDEITGSRGTIFATGTPVSNSMVELYSVQRYLQYDTLMRNGLQHFDSWASTFGETVTALELAPEGTNYRAKTRFAKFYNLPELMQMFREVADIQTSDMLKLPVPKVNYHNIKTKPSQIQTEMVAELAKRAEKVRARLVEPQVDNMLKITNDGRKLALDQRMIDPMLPDDPDSKVNACVENVYRIWEEHADTKAAQLVFCDLSTPKNDGSFNIYDDIRGKLTERGVPAEQIRFIHEATTDAQKKELFAKVRSGEVRVLLGSTPKMGAGTNVQDRLIAIHNLDCPWRPSDLEQRQGRIERQGNLFPEVEVYRYVTEQTFDAYLYQLVESKQKFISQIMTSKSPVRSAEDVDEVALSFAEVKMLATGDERFKEKMDLDIQVSKLRVLKQSYLSEHYDLEDRILQKFPKLIKEYEERIIGYEADVRLS